MYVCMYSPSIHHSLLSLLFTLFWDKKNTIPDKSLGTLAHFAESVRQIYPFAPLHPNSMLFIVINSSLLDSNIVRGKGGSLFQWCHYFCFKNSLSTYFHAIWSRRAKDFCRWLICLTTRDWYVQWENPMKGVVFSLNLWLHFLR